ncbi:MAG: hypothetical protein CMB80_06500 [Flammeovirgaceae bacterium]|nr:hypothetical protein [Flammeovirgaceae bacterium]HCX24941.1 hypothetical protein [Cytophagales bacterium]|tara:strand:- start:40 stop:444 length:405 start_codon:yes stop_codon:yes gene_type:complete
MKKSPLILLLVLSSFAGFSQIGISYHQSQLSFFGVNYQTSERFLTEFRLNTNTLIEDLSPELVLHYQFVKKETHEAYAGIGGRFQIDEGMVVPLGFNLFPFNKKQFGFHTEVAAIIGENNVFRGSWGIRYIFKK